MAFRDSNRKKFPKWHNAPVNSFGPENSELLIVGLAPGLRGANQTSRPFTGDAAGILLYDTLYKFSFTAGTYGENVDDGLTLKNCRITNAVRCVPPENKPIISEVISCMKYLKEELEAMENLRVVLALGTLAHNSVLRAKGCTLNSVAFGHGAVHLLPGGLILADSYHCSRYNTNTGRLTKLMFQNVFKRIRTILSNCP